MSDPYADAVVRLQDAIDRACSQAETYMTAHEIASALRRAAGEVEAEGSEA